MNYSIKSGWIKLSRNITNHWLWSDPERLKWWLDLSLMAVWEDRTVMHDNRVVHLQKGQLIASVSYLARRWDKCNNTVLKFLKQLENENLITRVLVGGKTSVICIVEDDAEVNEQNDDYDEEENVHSTSTCAASEPKSDANDSDSSTSTYAQKSEMKSSVNSSVSSTVSSSVKSIVSSSVNTNKRNKENKENKEVKENKERRRKEEVVEKIKENEMRKNSDSLSEISSSTASSTIAPRCIDLSLEDDAGKTAKSVVSVKSCVSANSGIGRVGKFAESADSAGADKCGKSEISSATASSTITPQCIDLELEALRSDGVWVEHVCRMHGISRTELQRRLEEFGLQCRGDGRESHISLQDAKAHFNSWYRKIVSLTSQNNSSNGKYKSSTRRGSIYYPAKDEVYTDTF